MATRIVTGTIHTPEGEPWSGFQLNFTLTPSRTMAHATLPYKTVTVTTDADGAFALPLEVNVQYEVELYTALIRRNSSTQYPGGTRFAITVPEGDTPISLSTIRASEIPDPLDPTLPNMVAQVESDLAAHEARQDNPHAVTADQVGLGNVANLAPSDLPVSDSAQAALDALTTSIGTVDTALATHVADAANPHVVTAAQTGAYTTGQVDALISDVDADIDSTAAALATHVADDANPHGVTAHQAGAYTQAETDAAIAPKADATALAGHVSDTSNPHGVTKAQVGLGSVANLAPSAMPVSDATQTALDAKADDADLTAHVADTENPHNVTAAQAGAYTRGEVDTALAGKITMPEGGRWYQVLQHGEESPVWADPDGAYVPDTLATPAGSANRDGALTPATSASVEVRGDAWWLCEGTVNLNRDPLYETKTGWAKSTLYDVVADESVRRESSRSIKVTSLEASTSGWIYHSVNFAETPQIATVSGHLRASRSQVKVTVNIQAVTPSGRDVIASSTLAQLYDGWTRFSLTTNQLEGATGIWVLFANSGEVEQGDVYWIVQPQVELKPYATPFTVGTRVPGTITLPHAIRPASILVRSRDVTTGTVRTDVVTLDGSDTGTFGTDSVGVITWDGASLVVATTDADLGYARQIEVMGVAAYNEAPPADVIAGLGQAPGAWTMGGMVPAYVPPAVTPWGMFAPTHKTGSGSTTAYVTDDTAKLAYGTLPAGTPVQVSGTVSGTLSKVNTQKYDVCWIPTSQIVTL